MTDDEFFALTNRIHRIESSIITFRSVYPDEPVSDTLRHQYADLTRLHGQRVGYQVIGVLRLCP